MDTNETDAVVDSAMMHEVSRNLLRWACGQRMMCGCGRALDCRSAVAWTWRGTQEFVACAACFDRVRGSSAESTAHFDGLASDVFDGRKLWPARAPEPKAAPRRNVARQADLSVGDRVLVRVSGKDAPVLITHTTSRGFGERPRRLWFGGTNERTGRECRFTAAKVRRILSRKIEESC